MSVPNNVIAQFARFYFMKFNFQADQLIIVSYLALTDLIFLWLFCPCANKQYIRLSERYNIWCTFIS